MPEEFWRKLADDLVKAAKETPPTELADRASNKLLHEYASGKSQNIKVGMKMPVCYETIKVTGKSVYVGNKTLQKIGWYWGLLKYKALCALEKNLEKCRHYQAVSGYDYEPASYSGFRQKTKWVEE